MIDTCVVRLSVDDRIVVWELPEDRAANALDELVTRGTLSPRDEWLDIPQGTDGVSLVRRADGDVPRQWALGDGIDIADVFTVVDCEPLLDMQEGLCAKAAARQRSESAA